MNEFLILACLNIDFDAVRVQILGKEDLPSLNETVSIIHAKEGRMSVMLETQVADGSALVAKYARIKNQVTVQSIDGSNKQADL